MKYVDKKIRIWIILSPVIVVIFMFVFAYFSMNWYQDNLQAKLAKSSNDTKLYTVFNKLHSQIESIIKIDEDIFKESSKQIDYKKLSSYFQFQINKSNDFTFVLKMEKDRKMNVLYSSAKSIKQGDILPKDRFILLDGLVVDSLLAKNRYFTNIPYGGMRTLYKLYQYFPSSQIVICVGMILEKHSVAYKYMQSVINDLNSTRRNILALEFIISLIGASIVSLIIKRTIDSFEKAKNELAITNESMKISNKILKNQLLVDTVTGLLNEKSLRIDISTMDNPKLILIDIDYFRKMSEYYSLKTIDKVIDHVKNALLKYTKEYNQYNMKLYRTDTSQFALLENAPIDTERYEELAIKLSDRLKGVRIKDDNFSSYLEFNCTIGFSLENENVYETAVTALRRAREKEKDYLCYFRVLGEEEAFREQIKGSDFIKKALESDKVIPFFQPIFDKEGHVVKHECLVRIIDENDNIVSPYMFLATSKRIKRYSQIEKVLIKKSLDVIQGTNQIVSINLSTRDMIDSEVKNYIINELAKRNIANQIILEIVEDESMDSLDRVTNFIDKVKSMGAKIAIDDFGSGYSNFSYMLSLKPDFVKIDGTLIKNIDTDFISHSIVSSIILFTKRLGIKTIAEFVHSKDVFETCKEMGIDEFQGFYLGEPKDYLL